jgi:hypothetical protein
MKRVLFVILAVLIVATTGVYAIYVRDLTAARAPPCWPQQHHRDVLRHRYTGRDAGFEFP